MTKAAKKKAEQLASLIESYHYQSSKVLDRLSDIAANARCEDDLVYVGSLLQAIGERNNVRDSIQLLDKSAKFYPGWAD